MKTAYRFLAEEALDEDKILAPHWRARERVQKQSVMLCLWDTTKLDFNAQHIDRPGSLSYEAQRGTYRTQRWRPAPIECPREPESSHGHPVSGPQPTALRPKPGTSWIIGFSPFCFLP